MEEQALCRKIAHGSQRALEEAIRRYSAYVVTVIHNRSRGCLSPEDEEELASDTFFALWNHAGDIHGGSLRAWLGAVARNATVSRLRSLSPTVPLEEELLPAVASPWEDWEETIRLQALLERLHPRTGRFSIATTTCARLRRKSPRHSRCSPPPSVPA